MVLKIPLDPTNPRLHDSAQIDAIAKGEGRLLAAQQLEWEDAAVLYVDDDNL